MMLDNSDRLSQRIAALDATIEAAVAPSAGQVAQLDAVTDLGATAAQELIAEVGVDMARFASAAHLVSWAKFCPRSTSRPARPSPRAAARTTHGWPGRWATSSPPLPAPTASWARDRRIAKRRGNQRAMVAVGNSVLVIASQLLGDPDARFGELGAEHYDARVDKQRRARNLAAQLQAVTGQRIVIRDSQVVIVQPEAA